MSFNFNGFNVGTDFAASVIDDFGNAFPMDMLGPTMEFESESLDRELEVVPISQGGVPIFQTVWAGMRGRFMFVRANAALSNMFIDLMNAYHTFGIIPQFTIAASVLNRDSSLDEYLYTGVQFSRPKFGNYRSEKEVDMGMEFRASRVKRTGAAAPFLLLAA